MSKPATSAPGLTTSATPLAQTAGLPAGVAPWKYPFLFAATVLGFEPVTVGLFFPGPAHVALIAPVLVGVLCYCFLHCLPLRQKIGWTAIGAGAATAALTAQVVFFGLCSGIGLVEIVLFPAPFWFPWLFLLAVSPLMLHHWAVRTRRSLRPMVAAAVLFAAYLLSGFLCLELWTCTVSPYVEQTDNRDSSSVLGPGVSPVGRIVCPPQGPSFLWSTDYGGDEWIWTVYSPMIRFWLSLQFTHWESRS